MRCYLHQIQNDRVVHDLEGSEFRDLISAENEAVQAARELMAIAVRAGRDIRSWSIVISDDAGSAMSRVLFANVIQPVSQTEHRILNLPSKADTPIFSGTPSP